MTTKQLLKKLENKSAFALAWSVLWRMWILILGVYACIFIVVFFIGLLVGIAGGF